ncbi:MAG: hypothetical protein IPG53_17635 [Ignavibacteriales bacterium]|nr:hypothetical protein [Ignavibacteriales bacterium]
MFRRLSTMTTLPVLLQRLKFRRKLLSATGWLCHALYNFSNGVWSDLKESRRTNYDERVARRVLTIGEGKVGACK